MASTINADNGVVSGSSGVKTTADTSGVLALQSNGTTALTINTDLSATFAGAVTASSFSGTTTTATNLAGGSNGTVPYQSASGTTQMLAAGTSGYFLKSNGAAAPSWAAVPATTPAGSTGQVQYNNAGAFGALSDGTSGQVLTSSGAGAAPTWSTLGSDYVKISTVTVSNGSLVIDMPSIFSTTYKFYVIQFVNLRFVSPYTRDMQVYWTANNGSTYPYQSVDGNILWGAGNFSATPRTSTTSIVNLVANEPLNVSYGYCGTMTVMNPAQAGASVSGFLDSTYYGSNYGPFQSRQGYTVQNAGAYTGIRIGTITPATFDSGTVYVYGIK